GALPQHRRLALVGDADRRDRALGGRDGLATGCDDALPDFLWIVLDPARLRVNLAQLAARDMVDRPRRIEQDRPGAGGALIDRQNVIEGRHNPGPEPAEDRAGASQPGARVYQREIHHTTEAASRDRSKGKSRIGQLAAAARAK